MCVCVCVCDNYITFIQMYPMAVVGTASRGLVIYQLEGTPSEFRVTLSLSLHTHNACMHTLIWLKLIILNLLNSTIAQLLGLPYLQMFFFFTLLLILYNIIAQKIDSPLKYQHRCVRIFKDKQNQPTGFALGSIEGRVAIQYINPPNP